MAVELVERIQTFQGLSTDTKPVDAPRGSTFLELDTDETFRFTGTHWHRDHSPEITVDGPITGFGELQVAEPTPIVQLQFPYAVNARLVQRTSGGSGGSTISSSLLTVATGITTASHEILNSVQHAKYNPGQSILARWTAIFKAAGTADTHAYSGVGNVEDGVGFGYKGTAFGVLHRFAGKQEYQTLTITTGAVTASGTITINLDGAATEVEVVSGDSVQAVARAIGAVAFNQWFDEVIGDTIVFKSHLAAAKTGTFSLVDTDTTGVVGSFAETVAGVAPTDTHIPQTSWNQDDLSGDFDAANPSGVTLAVDKGNVYQARFQWLGFGALKYYVEHGEDGEFIHVHTIEYANANTTPSMQNPTLPTLLDVDNGGTTTDITVKTSSMSIFSEGKLFETGLLNGLAAELSGTVTTETNLLAIKNKPTFQGVANRVEVAPILLTFSCNGSGSAKFHTLRATVDPILGGNPSFTDVGGTSVLAFDIAGTTLSGGSVVGTWTFGNSASGFQIDLTGLRLKQQPGSLVVFSIQTDGGTTDASLAFLGQDLF